MRAQRYTPKRVSEVKVGDSRVSIVGEVKSVGDNVFEIRDDSGRAEVFSDTEMKEGLVRIFCTVVDGKLKADVIQSLNGLDINLYHKAQELYRKVGL